MINEFTILHRGGAVLYKHEIDPIEEGNPIDNLIQEVLLEEKQSQTTYPWDSYTLRWSFANEFDLVFVAVYLNLSKLLYIEEFLEAVKAEFTAMFTKEDIEQCRPPYDFDKRFLKTLEYYEAKTFQRGNKVQKAFKDTKKGKQAGDKKTNRQLKKEKKEAEKAEKEVEAAVGDSDSDVGGGDANDDSAQKKSDAAAQRQAKIDAKFGKLKKGRAKKKQPKDPFAVLADANKNKAAAASEAASPGSAKKKKRGKVMRKWEGQLTKEEKAALDFSARPSKNGGNSATASAEAQQQQAYTQFGEAPKLGDGYASDDSDYDDDDDSDDEFDPEKKNSNGADDTEQSSGLFSFFKTLAGNHVLTEEDLEPVVESFIEKLRSKNVAADIAEQLCTSVMKSLVGKKLASFTSVKATARKALDIALTKILTPKRNTNIVQEVMQAKEEGRPYAICFVGVNGVGKSTSLAKICAYFKSKGFSVGIAACDTFRAGAIEQLKTHAIALDVPVYASAYNRDAASVAMEGMKQAFRQQKDVLLIDTAGRMQDNAPLMKSLSKLINLNQPDLTLFVGEALVGNDGVHQLTNFNKALVDLSGDKAPRVIDGIVLTKFDTIDDKVGAAISMTYTTGKPIMFVGVGQTYKDLRKMNAKILIKALLK